MIKYSSNENSLTQKWYYKNLKNIGNKAVGNFYSFFADNNKDRLDQRAILCSGKLFTYRDIIALAEDYAGKLSTLGIGAGDSIFMLSMPTPEAASLVLACAKLDVCVIMLSPSPDDARLSNLIGSEKIRFAFISESFLGAVFGMPSLMEKTVIYQLPHDSYCRDEYKVNNDYTNNFAWAKKWNDFLSIDGCEQETVENPSNILYVSEAPGTEPLGIAYSHKAMICASLMITDSQLGFSAGDLYESRIFMNAMACTSLQLLCPMAVGVAVCSNTELPFADPVIVPDDLISYRPTGLILQYSALYPILMSEKLSDYDFSSLKTLFNFGEYFPPDKMNDVLKRVSANGGTTGVKNCYGLSEANSIITSEKPGLELSSSAGSPCPGCRVYIVNPETEEELPLGTAGEIVYNSPAMMDGYYKNADRTAARFTKDEDGILFDKTGDLARMDEEGNLYLLGRVSDRFTAPDGNICYLSIIKPMFTADGLFSACIPTANDGKVTIHFISSASDEELKNAFENIKTRLADAGLFEEGVFSLKQWDKFPENHGRVRSDLLKVQTDYAILL